MRQPKKTPVKKARRRPDTFMVDRARKGKEQFVGKVKEVTQSNHTPASLATGFAIGSFIAILPTPGIGILTGLVLVLLFKKLNKYSLFGAMILFNPLVLAPLYFLSYWLGNMLVGGAPAQEFNLTFNNMFLHVSTRFLVGNIIVATVISTLGYVLVYTITQAYQRKQIKNARQGV
jgi:uncharacterized protein